MSSFVEEQVEKITADLRQDDLTPTKTFVKTKATLDEEQIYKTAQHLAAAGVNVSQEPKIDYSKMSMEDVYDLSIPIEAKPFMSADVLAIKLKDTNYVARWVNKNSQNLGDKIAKGFTYIVPEDLYGADAIQTAMDSQGHYCFHDVVAMKIDKATYFRALRAAYERSILTVDHTNTRKRAANLANEFMTNDPRARQEGYGQAAGEGKMRFYNPDIGV